MNPFSKTRIAQAKVDLSWISMATLMVYLFLSGCFTKKFVYLKVDLGPLPLYITEITLCLLLLARAKKILAACKAVPRSFLILLALYLGLGMVRFLASLATIPNEEYGMVKILKDTYLVFQAMWIFVALSFSVKELLILLGSALVGAGFAQFLGWLGFLMFGTYTLESATLIGIPVGNEAVNTLYILSFSIFAPWAALLLSMMYGKLWLVQFLLYFKRTWVFSLLLFTLPALYLAQPKKFKRNFLALILSSAIGAGVSWTTINHVANRKTNMALELKEELRRPNPALWAKIFGILFPEQSFEGESTQKPFSKKFFHGEAPKSMASESHGLFAFRLHLWKQAWQGFVESPFWGKGFGPRIVHTQVNGEIAYWDGNWFSGPHNSFLTIAFRMGIFGVLFLLGLNGILIRETWRSRKYYTPAIVIYSSAVINMNAFAFFNVALENPQSGIWYWFFIGSLLVALLENSAPQQTRENS